MRTRKKEEIIIRAAEKVFAKKGYHRTKVSDIVKVAKIARGTFYLYYKSKDNLFEKLLDELMSRIVNIFADIDYHNLNTREDFYRHIEKVSRRFTELVIQNKELTSIFFKELTTVGGSFQKKLTAYHLSLMEISKEFLNFCMKRGIIRVVNPEVVSYIASGMVRELFSRYLDSSMTASAEEIVREGVALYVRGLIRENP